jgi:hypothetical protein
MKRMECSNEVLDSPIGTSSFPPVLTPVHHRQSRPGLESSSLGRSISHVAPAAASSGSRDPKSHHS